MAEHDHPEAIAAFRELEQLRSRRTNFDIQCREVAERCNPLDVDMFIGYNLANQTRGGKNTKEIYDSTPALAVERFGAILNSLLTPPNTRYHKLKTNDPVLNRSKRVMEFFDSVNRALFHYRYTPTANFESQNQLHFEGLGLYGSGCLFIDSNEKNTGLRYRQLHLAETYFKQNHQRVVDTIYRYFPLSAKQAVQMWGKEKLPEKIVKQLETDDSVEFNFLHRIRPRADVDLDRKDFKGMEYESMYFCETEKCMLEEGGYRTFPAAVSRYRQITGMPYGYSPAMLSLPANKTLQEEKKTVLKQGQRIVDPIYLAHDDGIIDTMSAMPGSTVYGGVTADGRPLVTTLPTGRVDIGRELIQDEQAVINDVFLVRLFQILTERPQMTATEVLELVKEKGVLIAPTLGRQRTEYIEPMITREIDLLQDQGLLPEYPPELVEAQGEFVIQHDSPLSQLQRAGEATGLMQSLEMALRIAEARQDPSVLDFYEWEEIMPELLGDVHGLPPKWVATLDKVRAMQQQRAQQAQQQQMIEAAPGAAALAKAGVGTNQQGG